MKEFIYALLTVTMWAALSYVTVIHMAGEQ